MAQLADGNGITKKIGAMPIVANLHDKRIVEMADGELFYVITNGRNNMGAYGAERHGRGSLGDCRVSARASVDAPWHAG